MHNLRQKHKRHHARHARIRTQYAQFTNIIQIKSNKLKSTRKHIERN